MNRPLDILVLGDGFGAPAYTPRLRSLCDYLTRQGHRIQVVVETIQPLPFLHSYPIDEVAIYRKGALHQVDWAVKNVLSLLFDYKNRHFSHLVERRYGNRHFDLVFCTTFHTFPLRAAVEYGKRHHIPVHLDIRDIVEQTPGNHSDYLAHSQGIAHYFIRPFQRINIRRRNRMLRAAGSVSTVSPWHQQLLSQYNANTHLIYNGFDATQYTFLPVPTRQFVLSYIGKYFGRPLQDAELLFHALSQLEELPYQLQIHTNTLGMQRFSELSDRYHIAQHVHISGYIPTDQVVSAYHQSSILLIFSNKASDDTVHGMMTTKFFEALGCEKPVLCTPSDEECLAQTIQETNAGLASSNIDEIKAFILDKYHEWQTNGFTRQQVINKQQFSRQYQAEQFEQLFLQLIKHTR